MTISATVTKAKFTGDGTTVNFDMPAGFRVFNASHLLVTDTDPATGVATVKTLNVDYTVSGAGLYTGVRVTFNAAPAAAHIIDVKRATPRLQNTDLRNQGAFLAEIHEDEFDYLTMLVQELATLVDYDSGFNIPVAAATGSKAITFKTARAIGDTNYGVDVTPSWNTPVWISSKTNTGFTINFGVFAPASATLDWRAF